MENSDFADDFDRMISAYMMGVLVVAVISTIPYLLIPAIGVWLIGVLLGLPIFIAMALVVYVFRSSVHRHLTVWCCFAPFLALAIYAVVAQTLHLGGFWLGELLWEGRPFGLILTFVVSVISAALFHAWTREAEKGSPIRESIGQDYAVGVQP